MEPLSDKEHDELVQAVKDIVYFAKKRQLTPQEAEWIEWAKKELA